MPTRPYLSACVFVVDADTEMCRQLEALCATQGWSARVFGDASTLRHALQQEPAHGCVVANVHLPDMPGAQLQREVAAAGVHLPFIFLVDDADVAATAEVMRQGALDVLQKPPDPDILLQRIATAIAEHEAAIDTLAQLGELEYRAARLTLAEREVLERVVQGLPNKTIASELGLHVKSVEARRARAMRKMGAQSLPDLVRATVALSLPRDPRVIARVLSFGEPGAVPLETAQGSIPNPSQGYP